MVGNEYKKIERYNIENCYMDTSYEDFITGTIMVSKFSNEDIQQTGIENIRLIANSGYIFDEDNKSEMKFKFYYQEEKKWYDIDFSMFTEPTQEIEYSESFLNRFENLGVDGSNALIYKFKDIYFLMFTGWNKEKIIVYKLEYHRWASDGVTIDGDAYNTSSFSTEIYNEDSGDYDLFSLIEDINFVAILDEVVEEPTKNIFTTYYVNSETLRKIKESGTIPTEIIINTYSYPIEFDPEQYTEVEIKASYIPQGIRGNVFKSNYTKLPIFSFTVPEIIDSDSVEITIPFNDRISIPYIYVSNQTIKGYLVYEMLTNTTTLIVENNNDIIFSNIVSIGVKYPFKPTGELSNFTEPSTRLSYSKPKMFITGVGKSIKGNFIKGFIKEPIKNILKNELDILNSLLEKGVFLNEYN